MAEKAFWAMGMMSGTSLDGADAALIRTNGEEVQEFGPSLTIDYTDELRYRIREAIHHRGDMQQVARDLTLHHCEVAHELLQQSSIRPSDVKLIGFHGQTIDHRPDDMITTQIGDPSLLAERTAIDVVADFRRRDIAAGGQGAPLVPLYHAAITRKMDLPVAVLNIGGIANVTWVGKPHSDQRHLSDADILAFDTGPGNVLLNEWAGLHTGTYCDTHGRLALEGDVDEAVVAHFLEDDYFKKLPPKSLDRNSFSIEMVNHFSAVDGAATLAACTIASILEARKHFPEPAHKWVVAGGGRHNPSLLEPLKRKIPGLYTAEEIGWNGDGLEAQAFAFLAVRSSLGLPLTLPTTTGVSRAVTGGAFYRATLA